MLIVGAGVCAIALGVALGHLGIPYTIVEKNAELGGTWWINRYPGCGVDTPNHSYSYLVRLAAMHGRAISASARSCSVIC